MRRDFDLIRRVLLVTGSDRGPNNELEHHLRLLKEAGFHPTAIYPAGRFDLIEARVR